MLVTRGFFIGILGGTPVINAGTGPEKSQNKV
jgi:hypothetical protein